MKGVILAGGSGTRLYPITRVTNKHLLPVYNKPMIYYPIETLKSFDIKEITVVSGKEHAGAFTELLGDGSALGVNLTYKVQNEPSGIAHAIGLLENLFSGESFMAILGDNIFNLGSEESRAISNLVKGFGQTDGAEVFLKKVEDPERFGVAAFDGRKRIRLIVEKPKKPASPYAVTGLYIFDSTIFGKIKGLKPSWRHELELTDVNNIYLKEGMLNYRILKGDWTDAGTFESLYRASALNRKVCLKNPDRRPRK
jgi:glucose-1-phosphate thymidylyltransferase